MKLAHFDCFSGVSGDMVLGAIIDAGVPADAIVKVLDSLGLPIRLEIERVKRCGLAATKVTVHAEDQEDYRFLPDVEAIVAKGSLTPKQRDFAMTVFRCVAGAEAAVHGMPVEKVHFHEVGALDSIADIVGTAVGLDLLGVDRFTASPVAVGFGTVKCAHGIMPVPAPATALILQGVPTFPGPVKGEMATPTGAAILKCAVSEFVAPEMVVEKIGYGAGTKDPFEQPNVLRLSVGNALGRMAMGTDSDTVAVLETNLDDCPGEVIGFTLERLFAAGAWDAFVVPIQMKKNRPGVLLTCLCHPANATELETILFRETNTFGVRRTTATRSKLKRESVTVETPWGNVAAKRGTANGIDVVTPEYESCAAVARENNVPLRDVYDAVVRSAKDRNS